MINTGMNNKGQERKEGRTPALVCAFLSVLLLACLLTGVAAADSEGATEVVNPIVIDFAQDNENLQITIDYDETALFSPSATEYNLKLAQASIAMAGAAFSSPGASYAAKGEEAAAKRSANLKTAYEKLGFSEMEFHNYGEPLNKTDDYVAYGIAKKEIKVNDETWTLFAVQVRGSGYAGEWVSNFHIDPYEIDGVNYSEGFGKPAQEIYTTLTNKLPETNRDKVKIWISGFSRAAAVSNALGGELTRHAENLGLSADNIYVYTFATPNAVLINPPENVETGYTNIHNTLNPCDIVPVVPMSVTRYDWNYSKYGTTHYYNYGGEHGFTPAERSQITDRYKEITKDPYGYNPYTPKTDTAFLPVLFELCFSQTVAPDEYIADFYPYVEEMMSLMFCGEKQDATRLLFLNNNLNLLHPGDEKLAAAKEKTKKYSEQNEELDEKVLRFLISRAVEILWLFSDNSNNAVSNTASDSSDERQGPIAQFTDGTTTIGFYQGMEWDDSDAFLGKAAKLADNLIAEISALKDSGYDIKNITTITSEHKPEVYMSVLFSGISEDRMFMNPKSLDDLHAIIYDTKGGTMPDGSQSVEIYEISDTPVDLSEKEPAKEGYIFSEWVDEDGVPVTEVDISGPGYTRVSAFWKKEVLINDYTAYVNEWNIDKIETSCREGTLIVGELPSPDVTLSSKSILLSAVSAELSESELQYRDTPAVIYLSVPKQTAEYLAELSSSYNIMKNPEQVVLKCFDKGRWYNLKTEYDGYDKGAEKYLFHASTDKLSSFAVGVDKIKPKKRSSSSSSQETSVWLTAAPTPEPTPEPTPTPTIEPPAVVPLKPVTQTPESPVPFAGIAAGLFAAAVLCGMRRR